MFAYSTYRQAFVGHRVGAAIHFSVSDALQLPDPHAFTKMNATRSRGWLRLQKKCDQQTQAVSGS